MPDGELMMDDSQMTDRELLEDCQMTAEWLPDDCQTTAIFFLLEYNMLKQKSLQKTKFKNKFIFPGSKMFKEKLL